jgi:aspartyl protease family protein
MVAAGEAMRSLLFGSVLIVVAAVAAPGLLTRYVEGSGAGPAQNSAAAIAAAPETSPSASSTGVEFTAARDGHFYVDTEVNFRRVPMMVDTGATVVALRQSDAAAAGIRPHPSAFNVPVSTANGVAHAAEITIDSIMVREIEIRGVRALILTDDQLHVSLLGGSFLHRLRRFEVEDGRLFFEN